MRIPFSWLKEHAPIARDAMAVADTLIRLGHEVEGVEQPREAVKGVRVGQIRSMEKHPDADRLSLLSVDIGEDEPLKIVCGATNMKTGDKVPVATVGTTLPNGLTIKKGKIRGQVSCGMCCSETELGLAEHSSGLMILPEDAPVGAEVGEYLQLEEAVFDLSITPNRGDCMSVHGLARELAADAGIALCLPEVEAPVVDAGVAAPSVKVSAINDCPLYLARRIDGLRLADSPAWMQQRLLAAGMRPVNGVVDVLNYVMLDIGQPMHAFDAEIVRDGIQVRSAAAGEPFEALDGRKLELADGDLVIADDNGVLALAGIMGSEASGVTESTTSILLESACFRPARISLTRRAHAMVSEASMRFERGIDPLMVREAMERATSMIVGLFGGRVGPIVCCGDPESITSSRQIRCHLQQLQQRLGLEIDVSVDNVLRRMGFGINRTEGMLEVIVPPFRHDVAIAEDLSEEYARIIGFDAIPTLRPLPLAIRQDSPDRTVADAVEDGAVQVITYAFIAADEQRLFCSEDGLDLALQNPIADQMGVMRRSLWPGLLNVARHNMNRQQTGVALVERGRIYSRRRDHGHREDDVLAWLMAGAVDDDQWYAPARTADFFDLKGRVDAWLARRRLTARYLADDRLTGLQPGQSARLLVGRREIGVIGRVQQGIARRFDLEVPVFVAEIYLAALPAGRTPKFVPLPEFPSSQRDLVFLFDRGVQADAIVQAAQKAGGRLVTGIRIFDRYAGQGVPEGKVSLGLRITLQASERTLSQQEVDAVVATIVSAMEKQFGATLRG